MTPLFAARAGILILCLVLALYHDLREQKIKNYVTLPVAVFGLIINTWELGATGLKISLQGWGLPVMLLFILYYVNVLGAGDIKLFAAIGAVMGLSFVAYCFVFSVYIGGVIAVTLLIRKRELSYRLRNLLRYIQFSFFTQRISKYSNKGDNDSKFAFSLAIVPGAVIQLIITVINITPQGF